jgi:thiol-disulfide isomerase/thioredoxin
MSKKTWIILATVIIAVLALVGNTLSCGCSRPSNSTLPIITWNETTLSELEGTPVVLNFWSTSCYWCKKQLPYLESVAQQSGEEIKVIAINIGESASTVRDFFGDYEPVMIIALDSNGESFVDYCLACNNTRGAIPFTLFVDSEGVVQYVKIGAFSSEAALWDTLNDVFGITIP